MKYAEQLRNAIDHGKTGEKVNFPDPAAAPLGTDEEAAGTPLRPAEVEAAWNAERKPELASVDKSRDAPAAYAGQDVRQGHVFLKMRWQRVVFILGLAGAVLSYCLLKTG